MFERFSSEARAVVIAAERHAQLLGQDVRPQQLLLGILDQTDTIAVRTLVEMGVDLDGVRRDLAAGGSGPAIDSGTRRPFTVEARTTLELALREALDRGDKRITAEHLLLALLHEPDTAAAQVLARHGGDLIGVRVAVIDALDASRSPDAPERDPWRAIRRWRSGGRPPEFEVVTALQAQLDRLEREVTRLAEIVDRLARDADPE